MISATIKVINNSTIRWYFTNYRAFQFYYKSKHYHQKPKIYYLLGKITH